MSNITDDADPAVAALAEARWDDWRQLPPHPDGALNVWRLYHRCGPDGSDARAKSAAGQGEKAHRAAMAEARCSYAAVALFGRLARDHTVDLRCPCGRVARWYCPDAPPSYEAALQVWSGETWTVDPFPALAGRAGAR